MIKFKRNDFEEKYDFKLIYDENQNLGKRYVKQDLIGTPFCIAIDYESLDDKCVTIRYRDSMEQERVPIDSLHSFLAKETNIKTIFQDL